MTAGVPLKLKDSDHPVELQKFDTTGGVSSDQNYLAYQASLYLADQDSNNTGRIATEYLGSSDSGETTGFDYNTRNVGTYVNTFFDSAVGTSAGTGGLYTVSTIGTTLLQHGHYEFNDDSDVRRLIYLDSDASIGYTQTDGGVDTVIPQLKIKEMDSDTEDRLVDRINSYIYTNDYPGTYKLSSSSSITDYSVEKQIFTDTRTDNTTVPYFLHKRTTITAPTVVRPFAIKRSNGDSGDYQGLQEMTDRQIQQSLGCASKNRTATQDGGVGSYALLSSAQGTPASTGKSGTWVSKGTATDTRQVIEDATYTRSRTSTYLSQRNSTYSKAYSRDRASTFTQDFIGNYSRNFQDTYTKTRTSVYSPGFVGDFTGNYTRERDQNFTRTSTRTSTYTRDRNAERDTNFSRTQLYTGNFARNFVGDYVGTATVSINAGQNATGIGGFVSGTHTASALADYDIYHRYTLPNGSIARVYYRFIVDWFPPGSNILYCGANGILTTDSNQGTTQSYNGYYADSITQAQGPVAQIFAGDAGSAAWSAGGFTRAVRCIGIAHSTLISGSGAQVSKNLGSQANSKDFLGNYSGAFSRNFSRTVNYTGDFHGDFQGNYSRTLYFKGNYTGDFTGNYTRQSSRTREDSFARNFAGDFQGNYLRTSTRNFTRERNTQFQRTRESTYAGDFTGNYARDYHGDFTGDYTGTAVVTLSVSEAVTGLSSDTTGHSRNFTTGWSSSRIQGNYTSGGYRTGYVDGGQRLMRFYQVLVYNDVGTYSPQGTPFFWAYLYMAENSDNGAIGSDWVAQGANHGGWGAAITFAWNKLQQSGQTYYRQSQTIGSGTADYTRDSNRQSNRDSQLDSNRTSTKEFEGNYTGDFTGNYSRNFTGNYLRDSNRTRTSSYIGANEFARDFSGDFVGNYARGFTRTSSRTIGANYIGNYTGNYQRSFLGNYARTFAGNYVGTEIGSSNTNIETYTLYVRTA